jgi:predicted ATPase
LSKSHLQHELEQALSCYRGELLPGYYEDWVVEYRDRLSNTYISLLGRLLHLHENNREYETALEYAVRLLQLDPFSESAFLSAARLHVHLGDLSAARKQFQEMKIKMHEEYGLPPSRETEDAFNHLLTINNKPLPDSVRQQIPLVGRQPEWEALLQSWTRALREEPLLVVLEGEAGIGKTRLAEEFAWWCVSQGKRVLTANCYPSGAMSSYEPITMWLEQVDLDHLDIGTLTDLSRMLPAIKDRYPELPSPYPILDSWQLRIWYQSIEKTLLNGEPTVLILNDLQWSDKESLEMLNYLMRSKPSVPLLLLCTVRSITTDKQAEMLEFIEFHRSRRKLIHLMIQPLTEQGTHLLIRSLTKAGAPVLTSNQIHEETGGNPLFIHEIVRSTHNNARQEDFGSTVVSLMVQRLADLPSVAQGVIETLAVLKKPASLAFLSELADIPEKAAEQIDLLLRLRILNLSEKGLLDFYHERMRKAAEFRLSSSKKLLLHEKLAGAMVRSERLRSFTSAEIAYHYESAGMEQEATPYLINAAQEANRIYSHLQVIHFGLKALPSANQEQKLDILSLIAQAYRMSGQWKEAENAYRTWLEQCEYNGPLEKKAIHEIGLGNCLRLQGNYAEALSHLETSLRIFITLEQREGMADAYGNIGILHQYLGDYNAAASHLQKSIELGADGQETEKFLGILGNVYYEQGQYPEAIQTYTTQLRKANDNHNPVAIAKALGGIGLTHLELHEFDLAYHSFHEKLQLSRSMGDRMGTAISIGLIGRFYSKAGYHQEACACYLYILREALKIGDVRAITITLGLLGSSMGDLEMDQEAIWCLDQSIGIAKFLGTPFFECDSLFYKSMILMKRLEWKEATDCIQNAQQLAVGQHRAGLGRMLNILLIRSRTAIGILSLTEVANQLQRLSEQPVGLFDTLMIHTTLWELCGVSASRDQAAAALTVLYRNSPVPYYTKWVSLLGINLDGTQKTVPPVPTEVRETHVTLEELKDKILAIRHAEN